jgi:hypothetical protein
MAKVGITSDNNYAGGITYAAQPFILGAANGTAINGGFNFDLPLATVASFTNRALDFSANNSKNAMGFVKGVIDTAQQHVDTTNNSALAFLQSTNEALVGVSTQAGYNANFQTLVQAQHQPKGGCFITTAICEGMGKPDDCEELTKLRAFRDAYMLADPKRAKMVRSYYNVAPGIVDCLDSLPDEGKVAYAFLRENYLYPAIALIDAGKNEDAMIMYENMVVAALELARESAFEDMVA